jgi:hypothetical protein
LQVKSQEVPEQIWVPLAGVVGQAAHVPPQSLAPALQVRPHAKPSHVDTPLGEPGHAVHDEPQLAVDVFDRHWFPHRWKPLLHTKSQAAPVHVGVALAGVAAHPAHTPAHSRKPELQVRPQETPSQVAAPLAGVLHAEQELPQLLGEVFDTHWVPHRWKPLLHARLQLTPSQPATPFGSVGHAAQALPQLLTELFARHWLPQR